MTHKEIRKAILSDPELRELWRMRREERAGNGAKLAAMKKRDARLGQKEIAKIARSLGIRPVDVIIARDLEESGVD